jgi:N-acetyl-gamma-glutamyl-phosphate reductase
MPHLLPLTRGMECTMYVRVASAPARPALRRRVPERAVRRAARARAADAARGAGTNRCAIGWRYDARTGYAIVMTTLDNLGKGAAGQAVQCMNVALGLDETAGLDAPALVP